MNHDTAKRILIATSLLQSDSTVDTFALHGYHVLFCNTGKDVERYMTNKGLPHLLIIGNELPDQVGVAFCEKLREIVDLPIIMISENEQPGEAVYALRFVDDYVRYPLDIEELIMRIRGILSRVDNFDYASGPRVMICEHLFFDIVKRVIIVDGEERQLTPTESILLQVLIKHGGRVVDADVLLDRIWQNGPTIQDRNILRVHMHRLRNKLVRHPDDPSVIDTARGIGYSFVGC